jgi:hypothetical protein
MYGRRSSIRVKVLRMAGLLALALGPSGCKSDPPPSTAAERTEVYCNSCRKKVAREDTETRISPEGTDAFICHACIAHPPQGKPAARSARDRSASPSRRKT